MMSSSLLVFDKTQQLHNGGVCDGDAQHSGQASMVSMQQSSVVASCSYIFCGLHMQVITNAVQEHCYFLDANELLVHPKLCMDSHLKYVALLQRNNAQAKPERSFTTCLRHPKR